MMRRYTLAAICGIACVYGLTAANAQPVDSNIAVMSYAQSRGTPCTACSGDLFTSCSSDADCVSKGKGTCINSRGSNGCGGCYPDGLPPSDPLQAATAQLPKVNPEWQAIAPMIPVGSGGDPSVPPASLPVRITGSIALSKSPGDDFPGSHITPDYNAEIIPDDPGRLATGNTNSRVEFEWEGDKFPLFAWAGEGDRLIAEGRWIFDCGHPDPNPGTCSNNNTIECIADSDCGAGNTCVGGVGGCTGSGARCILDADCTSGETCTNPAPDFAYQSELHPPYAAVMIRDKSLPAPHANRTAPAIPAAQADVYISADAGGAGDLCTVTHYKVDSDVLFNKQCFVNKCSVTTDRSCRVDKDCAPKETCITLDPAQRVANINAHDFVFDLPLPAPPSDSATLQVKTKSFKPKGGIMPKPVFTLPTPPYGATPVLNVSIPMSQTLSNGKTPNVFAERISAAWKEDMTSLTHVQVKLKSITVNNPLKQVKPAVNRLCTNPHGKLSSTSCSTDKECPAGVCTATSNMCHKDQDCGKTDTCAFPSRCVGGTPPGWDLWAEVNGDWVKFKKLDTIGAKAPYAAAPYVTPTTPLVIPQNLKFDEFVPPTGTVHIKATGHSLNCLATLFGNNLKDGLHTYDLGPGAACLGAGSKDAGKVEVTLTGPDFGTTTPGQPVTVDVASTSTTGGTCSATTTRLCVQDDDCPGVCSVTTGQCRADGDCKHCSGDTSKFCAQDADCTSPQTCVSGSETCAAESCTATGGSYTLKYSVAIIP